MTSPRIAHYAQKTVITHLNERYSINTRGKTKANTYVYMYTCICIRINAYIYTHKYTYLHTCT